MYCDFIKPEIFRNINSRNSYILRNINFFCCRIDIDNHSIKTLHSICKISANMECRTCKAFSAESCYVICINDICTHTAFKCIIFNARYIFQVNFFTWLLAESIQQFILYDISLCTCCYSHQAAITSNKLFRYVSF